MSAQKTGLIFQTNKIIIFCPNVQMSTSKKHTSHRADLPYLEYITCINRITIYIQTFSNTYSAISQRKIE